MRDAVLERTRDYTTQSFRNLEQSIAAIGLKMSHAKERISTQQLNL